MLSLITYILYNDIFIFRGLLNLIQRNLEKLQLKPEVYLNHLEKKLQEVVSIFYKFRGLVLWCLTPLSTLFQL